MSMMNVEELKQAYPKYEENKSFYDNRFDVVLKGFENTYGNASDIRFFSAPGRIEIGGNHTDHQHGCVLAGSIDLDILGCAKKTDSTLIRVASDEYDMVTVDISNLEIIKEEENSTEALIRGVFSQFSKHGFTLSGIDIYCISNVLKGSGLSSSAAFEIFLGTIINKLFCDGKVSNVEIAQIGQYAENVYFGKPSGLLDQMACSVGNVVAIDFHDPKNPVVDKVDFDFTKTGYSICIIDSGADHADLTDEYSAIPMEMKKVAKYFGKDFLREISLSEMIGNFNEIREVAGDRATLRAIHFLKENEKAIIEANCLKENKFEEFLQLVKKSGQSSYMYLQNVYVSGAKEHQEVAIGLALCDVLLKDKGAYRVHGGGFAGTLQAFVPNDMLDGFKMTMESVMGENTCHVLSIRNVGGIEITKAN